MITACTSCRKKLVVKDESIGKKARCPHCKEIFVAESSNEVGSREKIFDPIINDKEEISEEKNFWAFAGGDKTKEEDDSKGTGQALADEKTLRSNAIAAMRSAAHLMFFALVVSIAVSGVRLTIRQIWFFNQLPIPVDYLLDCFIWVIAIPYFICIGVAVKGLYSGGPRSVIIAGVLLESVLLIEWSYRLWNSLILQPVANFASEVVSLCIYFASIVLVVAPVFAAIIFATIALGKTSVRQYYANQIPIEENSNGVPETPMQQIHEQGPS